jgi:hypothetical protein
VLSRVDEDLVESLAKDRLERRLLDQLRTRADDGEDAPAPH